MGVDLVSAMNVQNVSTATLPKLETLWAGDQKVATSPVENDTVSSKGLQGPLSMHVALELCFPS